MRFLLGFMTWLSLTTLACGQYTVSDVISALPYPVTFEIAQDGRYYVCLKGGDGFVPTNNAKVNIYAATGNQIGQLWNFTDSAETYFERGVLGVAIDPDWNSNHFVYVFYNHVDTAERIRVVRFTEVANTGTNPMIIFDYPDPFTAGNHTGGNIHFRPGDPDHLYITIGDRATSSNAQLLTNPCGKILRIGKDGAIPTDNPFYDDGDVTTGNDDRIYAYGLRNSFDFTFSPVNDSLYASENGLNTWDEINQISPGMEYGWPACEGNYMQGSVANPCNDPNAVLPMDVWGAPVPAVTGILIYNHALMPEFQGHLLVVDYNSGHLEDFTLGGPALNQVVSRSTVPLGSAGLNMLTDINQGVDGCLYVIQGGYTSSGKIRKICPAGTGLTHVEHHLKFSIAPNPAIDLVQIHFRKDQENTKLELMDLTGRIVEVYRVNGDRTVLDCAGLARGTYLVQVTDQEGNQYCQKLILQ